MVLQFIQSFELEKNTQIRYLSQNKDKLNKKVDECLQDYNIFWYDRKMSDGSNSTLINELKEKGFNINTFQEGNETEKFI